MGPDHRGGSNINGLSLSGFKAGSYDGLADPEAPWDRCLSFHNEEMKPRATLSVVAVQTQELVLEPAGSPGREVSVLHPLLTPTPGNGLSTTQCPA